MLRLALPTGSLQKPTIEMFESADLPISYTDSRCYESSIHDPRVASVRWLRPQEIPIYVAEGRFDLGISGYDWIIERDCKDRLQLLSELPYSRQTNHPVRIVAAVHENSPIQSVNQIPPNSRITTEYVSLTRRYFDKLGIPVQIEFSYGTTEAKVPEMADIAVELTESGSSLRANHLRIIETLLVSSTRLIANPQSWQSSEKRAAIEELLSLLLGAMEARGKVLVKMNVSASNLEKVLQVLPAMKSPTVSQLFGTETEYYAVESVAEKCKINILIPELKKAGATDLIELPITKIVR